MLSPSYDAVIRKYDTRLYIDFVEAISIDDLRECFIKYQGIEISSLPNPFDRTSCRIQVDFSSVYETG